MEKKIIDVEEAHLKLTELLIESYHPEDNAYNTGIAHAILVISGGDVRSIRKTRDARREKVLSK